MTLKCPICGSRVRPVESVARQLGEVCRVVDLPKDHWLVVAVFCFVMLRRGAHETAIAEALEISPHTVRHRSRELAKFPLKSRVNAGAFLGRQLRTLMAAVDRALEPG